MATMVLTFLNLAKHHTGINKNWCATENAKLPDHDKADLDRSIKCNTVNSAFRPLYVSFWHFTGRFVTQTAFSTITFFCHFI